MSILLRYAGENHKRNGIEIKILSAFTFCKTVNGFNKCSKISKAVNTSYFSF